MPSLCPSCQYDLSGLPDGACPECGDWFTHAQLADLAQRNATGRGSHPGLVLSGSISLATLLFSSHWISTLDPDLHRPAALASLAFVFYAIGMNEQRGMNRWLRLGLIAMPLAVLANRYSGEGYQQVVDVTTAMFAGIAIGIACQYPRLAAWVVTLAGVGVAVRGLAMLIEGIVRRQRGFIWTDYDWPLTNHDGYGDAIQAIDALWFGSIHIVAACGSVALAWMFAKMKRRKSLW